MAPGSRTSAKIMATSRPPINAFEPHLAGVGEDGRAIAFDVLIEEKPLAPGLR
jgi:hypothetical protein